MNVQDLLKNPQLFAVKKDGVLQVSDGLAGDKIALIAVYLFNNHGVVGCDKPDCDWGCLDQAWAKHADGATIVPVTVVEIESERTNTPNRRSELKRLNKRNETK